MTDFTIVIPSYNQGPFLGECIESVVNSARFGGLECQLIVVDNCSTDSTVDVLRGYESDIDICLIEPDSGQSNAINKGFACATGRIVNWLCCDDRLNLDALSILNRAFADSSQPDVVCGRASYYNSERLLACSRTSQFSTSLEIFMSFARIVQPATFWRREALAPLLPLDEDLSYVMDLDLWLKYLSHSDSPPSTLFIEDVLSVIILHDNCKSIADIQAFRPEITMVTQRAIRMATKNDGSFSVYGVSFPSALDLELKVHQTISTAYLISDAKSLRLLPLLKSILLLMRLPSLIRHFMVVRPEVLRMFS